MGKLKPKVALTAGAWFLGFAASVAAGEQPPPLSAPAQGEVASEEAAALATIAKTKTDVRRKFVVVWHAHGLFLIPADHQTGTVVADIVEPDIQDPQIQSQIDEAIRSAGGHLGQRLVCDCSGVEWSFYFSKRFLIREAKFGWGRP